MRAQSDRHAVLFMNCYALRQIFVTITVCRLTPTRFFGYTHNLCLFSDGNRQKLLDVGLVQAVLSSLDAYGDEPGGLELEDLMIAKTSIGFLLNASMKNGKFHCRIPLVLWIYAS